MILYVSRPLLLLSCVGVLGSCQPVFQREVAGVVLLVEGVASVSTGGKAVRLTKGTPLEPRKKITSLEGSRVDLMLLPGLLLELDGKAAIEVTALKFSKDGNELDHGMKSREARMRLLEGTLLVSIGQAQDRSRLVIETSKGVFVAGSGRTLRLRSDDHKMRLVCLRGKTIFQPAGGSELVKIAAGFFKEWPASATDPQPLAQAGAEVQAEVFEILEAEKSLRLLERANHWALAPWQRL
jgi:hypothetical protein